MDKLYDHIAFGASRLITRQYSTSFSASILLLGRELRNPIYGVYGFVRLADEIVDTYTGNNKAGLLARFKTDTYTAIDERVSLNPVLHAFQKTVHQYNIDPDLVEAFFHSMEMDLVLEDHNRASYDEYIYGSAEVVGLMCLKIFLNGDQQEFDKLKGAARSLGAAFQKVNFLRDLKDDYLDRGRTYFPALQYDRLTEESMATIHAEIEQDFQDAYAGIIQLPESSRLGVYTAYTYYRHLFNKIKGLQVQELINNRVRVPNYQKLSMIVANYVRLSLL